MSRLDDTLRRDLRVIADRATPSPDAWQQILIKAADQEPTQETEIIMLTENTLTARRWPLVAAAAAIVALAVGAIVAIGTGGDDQQPADTPTPTVAPAPENPDDQSIDDQTVDDQTVDEPVDEPVDAEPIADAAPQPWPAAGSTAPPGRYTTDAFGVPATFEIPDVASSPWTVYVNNQEAIMFGHDDSTFVAIKRIGSFFGADEARDPATRGLGSIPPDDIDRWIEENGLIVDDSREVTVGSRTAQFRTVRLPADVGGAACPGGVPPCLHMVSSSADQQAFDRNPTTAMTELAHSMWIVELDDFEPLGILAYTSDPDHQTWLDEIAPVIESLVLGEPAPATTTGTARLPLRATVSAPFSGVRTNGEQLPDGSISIAFEATTEGQMTGEIVGTGWALAGIPTVGHDENTFSGTIDGVGTGSISWVTDWTGNSPADMTSTDIVTGGTGDFAGATGTLMLALDSSDSVGGVDAVAGTYTFELVIPRSG